MYLRQDFSHAWVDLLRNLLFNWIGWLGIVKEELILNLSEIKQKPETTSDLFGMGFPIMKKNKSSWESVIPFYDRITDLGLKKKIDVYLVTLSGLNPLINSKRNSLENTCREKADVMLLTGRDEGVGKVWVTRCRQMKGYSLACFFFWIAILTKNVLDEYHALRIKMHHSTSRDLTSDREIKATSKKLRITSGQRTWDFMVEDKTYTTHWIRGTPTVAYIEPSPLQPSPLYASVFGTGRYPPQYQNRKVNTRPATNKMC